MRRAPIVLSASVVGSAAVLGFQPREPAVRKATAAIPAPSATPQEPSPSATPSSPARTVTGDAFDTQYGAAQVRVTVQDDRITEVEAIRLQGNDPKSVQISGSAEPALRESALAKQSADVDAVSGATVTSASYEASLQSALDQLAFEAADGSRGASGIPEVEEDHHGPRGE